jgi:hypothetical protein
MSWTTVSPNTTERSTKRATTLGKRVTMGGSPYWYFVAYEKDVNNALQRLRDREFEAGRYHPVLRLPVFPVTESSPRPGAQHRSIKAALDASREDGTRSILDIKTVGPPPVRHGVAVPLSAHVLESLYATAEPTRQMVEENMEFFNDIDRGECIYVTVYKDGQPDELFFAGYSYD